MKTLIKSLVPCSLLIIYLLAGTAAAARQLQDERSILLVSDQAHTAVPEPVSGEYIIRIMSLNLAHGRGTGMHQAFTSIESIKHNLQKAAAVILRERVNIVALQEADGPSAWSGNFNHVEYLLDSTGMDASFQGLHVKGAGLQYGTSILADTGIIDMASYQLSRSLFTLPKGFVISTVQLPDANGRPLDLVSVHLDFLSARNRNRQAQVLASILKQRKHPLILMGDFNADWDDRDGVLRYLADALDLLTWQPERDDLVTFPRTGARVDWILVSKPLEFRSLKVLRDDLSDHRAVVAEIRFAGS